MSDRRQRLLAGVILLLLGVSLPPRASAATYNECTFEIGEFDAANLGVNLTCIDGGVTKTLHTSKEPLPLNTPKDFEGTPIRLFPSDGVVVEIAKNAEHFTLTDSTFGVLPSALQDTEAPLTLRDAKVTLIRCAFKENDHSKSGGIHLVGEDDEAVATLTPPASGPYVQIIETTFEGGSGAAGALFIDSFPFVSLNGSTFLPNKEPISSFIEHSGFGTVLLDNSKFEGPEDVEAVKKATALFGSGSGTLLVTDCNFTRMVAGAVDWESNRDDNATLSFTRCTFADCYTQRDGGVFMVTSPLTVKVQDSTMRDNTANDNGGVFSVAVRDPADFFELTISNCEISGNKAGVDGSVLFLEAAGKDPNGYTAEVIMEATHVRDNLAATPVRMKGGGFVNLTITGGSFENNVGMYEGGALALEQMARVELSDVLFKGNQVTEDQSRSSYPHGGAINCKEAEELRVTNSRFLSNKLVTSDENTGGGAIYFSNEETPLRPVDIRILHIQNSTFTENAARWRGGCILASKVDQIHVLDSHFKQDDTIVKTSGGIIVAAESDVVELKGSKFMNGKATEKGGALALTDCVKVSVVDSTLEGNSVGSSKSTGGAISMECGDDKACTLDVAESKFISNSAVSDGGALLVASVTSCNITNTEFTQKEKVSGNGGAISIVTKELNVVGGAFVGGESGKGGGALYVENAESIKISGTEFEENRARTLGSVLSLVPAPLPTSANAAGAVATIAGATFTRNTAYGVDGGCVHMHDIETFSMSGSEFSGNRGGGVVLRSVASGVDIIGTTFAEGESEGPGAAVNLDNTPKVTIDGSTFHANMASDGGAIHLTNVTALTIADSKFTGNKGKRYGGGAHLSAVETADLSKVTFSGNKLDSAEKLLAGGGLAMKAVDVATLTEVTVTENGGDGVHGGGISAYEGKSITLEDCTFDSNNGDNAGGLSVQELTTEAKITGSTFSGNKAGNGGAVYIVNTPTVDATACQFDENEADNDGGAIRVHNGTTTFKMVQAVFNNNQAKKGSGGGISTGTRAANLKSAVASVDQLSCEKCTFSGHYAKQDGGSVNVYGSTEVSVTSSQFKDSFAQEGNGGSVNFFAAAVPSDAVYQVSNTGGGKVVLEESDFSGSEAKKGNGGSLAVTGASESVLSDVNITDSKGQEGGAAFFDKSSNVAITDVKVSKSTASDGGAILMSRAESLEITDSTFVDNTAHNNGGTLSVIDTNATTIDDSVIQGGEATGKGGALYLSDSGLTMLDSMIQGNTAESGGGFALSGESDVTLDTVDFTNNTATSWKGSVLFTDSCKSTVAAEGACIVDVPFKKGFGGMSNEADAREMAFDVEAECEKPSNDTLDMGACMLRYNVISGLGTIVIVVYILLGVAGVALLVMFLLAAIMKSSLAPAQRPAPQEQPLMDEGKSMA